MVKPLDKRLNAYRADLADITLQGTVEAKRFVEGAAYHVAAEIAPIHPTPAHGADLDTQALGGEAVTVFDIADGWAWCQLVGDGYVGYVPADLVAPGAPAMPTHKVATLEAFVYAEPTARSKPLKSMLFASPLTASEKIESGNGDFFELAGGGYVGARHVEPIDATEPDYVHTISRFVPTPYLWGGKSVRGIDCSGLVQLGLLAAGISCPRDTDMQQRELPGDIDVTDDILDRLQRGDIVFWPGHVGTMIDASIMVHASGRQMSTQLEPIAAVAGRSRGDGPVVAAVKRLMPS